MKIKPSEKSGGVIVELGPGEAQLSSPGREEINQTLPVFKLKNILVPVDFSECMKKALLYAVPFAKQFDAELTLLHVVPPYIAATEVGGMVDVESMDVANEELQEIRDRLGGSVRCNTLLRKGSAQHEIVDAAKELGSDLIILSTHGRTGLKRIVMGSAAEKVVRHASCPVLIVRENEHEFIAGSEVNLQAGATSVETGAEMRSSF
jgi:universal stress protein A